MAAVVDVHASYVVHRDTAANRPASVVSPDDKLYIFEATDTGAISVWSKVSSAWRAIDRSDALLAGGSRPLTADWDAGAHTITSEGIIAGDPGAEGSGVTVYGNTFDSSLKVSVIGGSMAADLILHRHSTSVPTRLLATRSKSDTNAHAAPSSGDSLFDIYAAGWDGTDYHISSGISFIVDGSVSGDNIPGRIVFFTGTSVGFPVERMRINNSGALGFGGANFGSSGDVLVSGGSSATPSWKSKVTVSAYVNTAQTGIVDNTFTLVEFNAEQWDVGGYFDSTTNFRWTPPAGRYRISIQVRMSTAGVIEWSQVRLLKNGSTFITFASILPATNTTGYAYGSIVVEANGTDYFEVHARSNTTGATWGISAGSDVTWFQAEQV